MSETTVKRGRRLSVKQITLMGMMAAVICVLAPFSVPIGPVPISLTNLAIYFALYLLGMVQGTVSYVIYLLIGLIGIPVFSGFTSGPEKLFGPTGGYLIGFIPMAVISGYLIDRHRSNRMICLGGMFLGTVVCYGFGTLWLTRQSGLDLRASLFAGVIPFIPGDLIKMLLAMAFGPQIRRRLKKVSGN